MLEEVLACPSSNKLFAHTVVEQLGETWHRLTAAAAAAAAAWCSALWHWLCCCLSAKHVVFGMICSSVISPGLALMEMMHDW
jgi:hypothetical protein